jgi:hypothetical protein
LYPGARSTYGRLDEQAPPAAGKAREKYAGGEWAPLLELERIVFRRDRREAQAMLGRVLDQARVGGSEPEVEGPWSGANGDRRQSPLQSGFAIQSAPAAGQPPAEEASTTLRPGAHEVRHLKHLTQGQYGSGGSAALRSGAEPEAEGGMGASAVDGVSGWHRSAAPRNPPGRWDFFLACDREKAGGQTTALCALLRARGQVRVRFLFAAFDARRGRGAKLRRELI